ncbi:MAG TPA: YciI family protein [Solirubrobacterales bacterium]|nr:YciI family protein [Solirubrobacterales bacterium]
MKYALLIYNREGSGGRSSPEIPAAVAAVLERPEVRGYSRLEASETATTVTSGGGRTLLTDGPFVDSKEYLGGLIFLEAPDLDGALAIATELQEIGITTGIEVRPVFDQELGGA